MSKDGKTWLSHTGVEGLERCPRCFWLQYRRGIRQPEGIVSRLANRFDTVLKNYFSLYRETDELPPMIKGKVGGKLQNPFQETYFVRINESYGFYGKLDECLVNSKGELTPVDFKTASSDPRDKEILSAYQSQIDDYIFLLEENGRKTTGEGYLIFFFPNHGKKLHEGFPMVVHLHRVIGNPEKSKARIQKAIKILDGPLPEPSADCPFCKWYDSVKAELT